MEKLVSTKERIDLGPKSRMVNYAHVSDDDLTRILGERGVAAPDPFDRAAAEQLMMDSEPGVSVVSTSFSPGGVRDDWVPVPMPPLGEVVILDAPPKKKAAAKKKSPAKPKVVALGNGWYQVGDEKYHGKAALHAAGYEEK